MNPELISIELTNRCQKACWFCYNHSLPEGDTTWTPDEVVSFVEDCATHGVKAVSFGGGEPLQYEDIFEIFTRLKGTLFRSMTTNGLLLDEAMLQRLVEVEPDKIHVSIHFPQRRTEVERVIRQVHEIEAKGIRSGINFLVTQTDLIAAQNAAKMVRDSGIGNDRIVYLPMRSQDTPTPKEMATVAGGNAFQSMSCLMQCAKSPRFVSISWDKQVAWCSYTVTRSPLLDLTYQSLLNALDGLGLEFCGDKARA